MTDGGSPWYVSTAFTPRRFDVADLRVLFGEWAESESASASRVEDAVMEGVIALTQGHRGWSMQLAGACSWLDHAAGWSMKLAGA